MELAVMAYGAMDEERRAETPPHHRSHIFPQQHRVITGALDSKSR